MDQKLYNPISLLLYLLPSGWIEVGVVLLKQFGLVPLPIYVCLEYSKLIFKAH